MKLSEFKHQCITPLQKQNFNTFAIANHLENVTVSTHERQSILKDRPTVLMGGRTIKKRTNQCKNLCKQGKTASIRKKYCNRNSPPYPANKCKSTTQKKGNDGNMWKLAKTKSGVQRWVKTSKKKTKKKSTRRRKPKTRSTDVWEKIKH